MHEWGRKRELSLGVRILLQVLRFSLAALFFYIAYLGIIWRSTPPTPPAQKRVQPAAPAKPAPPAQATAPVKPASPPAPKPPAEQAR